MEIIILTTSHNQFSQVEKLLASFSEFALTHPCYKVSCIIVESSVKTELYDGLLHCFSGVFEFIKVLSVDSSNYWTGAVFSGFEYLCALSEKAKDLASSKIVLINCDVLPTSWEFLLSPKATLETLATVSNNNIVKRSGFTLPFPFIAYHFYPFNNKVLPRADWFCKSVPTRLVVFPFVAVSVILSHRYLVKKLPHYSADLVITSLLSSAFSTSWRVRIDCTLVEDTTTTGLKNTNSVNLANASAALLGRKSVFNVKDALLFPIYFAKLSLPFYCIPSYVLTFWLKYVLKILIILTFNTLTKFIYCRSL